MGLGYVPCAGEKLADVLASSYEIDVMGTRVQSRSIKQADVRSQIGTGEGLSNPTTRFERLRGNLGAFGLRNMYPEITVCDASSRNVMTGPGFPILKRRD